MTNQLLAISQMIAARTDELRRRQALGGFDEADVGARLDELTAVMELVADLMRAEVAELAGKVQTV